MARAILLALILVAVVQIVYYYPQLPEVVASHFDGSGTADGWSSKQAFALIIGGVELIMVLSFLVLPAMIRRMPDALINMPNKDYWLAPERRDESMARLRDVLIWSGVATMLLLIYVTQLTIDANLGPPPARLDGAFGWVLGAYLAFIALWVVWIYRIFAVPSGADRQSSG